MVHQRHTEEYCQDLWSCSPFIVRDNDKDKTKDIVDDEACADKRDDEILCFHGRLHYAMKAYSRAIWWCRECMLLVYQQVGCVYAGGSQNRVLKQCCLGGEAEMSHRATMLIVKAISKLAQG